MKQHDKPQPEPTNAFPFEPLLNEIRELTNKLDGLDPKTSAEAASLEVGGTPFDPSRGLIIDEEEAKRLGIQQMGLCTFKASEWNPSLHLKQARISVTKDGELDFELGEEMTISAAAREFMDYLDRHAHQRNLVLARAAELVDAGIKPIGKYGTVELALFEALAEAVTMERGAPTPNVEPVPVGAGRTFRHLRDVYWPHAVREPGALSQEPDGHVYVSRGDGYWRRVD